MGRRFQQPPLPLQAHLHSSEGKECQSSKGKIGLHLDLDLGTGETLGRAAHQGRGSGDPAGLRRLGAEGAGHHYPPLKNQN